MTEIKRTELRLVDKSKNINKFYRLILTDKNTVRFEWGRIGTTPRSQTKDYGNLKNIAEHHYEAKRAEKLRKGYSIYSQENLEEKTAISPENNYIEIQAETVENNYDQQIIRGKELTTNQVILEIVDDLLYD